MQTKHGKLNCVTRVTNYIHWLDTESENGDIELGLKDIIQKEYSVTLELEGGQDAYAIYIDEERANNSIHKSMLKTILRQTYIIDTGQVELILRDLLFKGILLPGNYVIRL